ncbi:MAG TPA: nitrate reductase molybdenum cofactor assembly chaperone [Advenella sp.]|nr:nitrate reductase molybdenum cofactor assembly chaperone [Advenella sp.]
MTCASTMQSQTKEPPQQLIYAVLSALLGYPDEELIDALPLLRSLLNQEQRRQLAPMFDLFDNSSDLIQLQEQYVETFDSKPSHSLHLFEHIHGESRDRGQAMVDLRNEYIEHGLLPDTTELPDYIPLFLEFLSQIPAEKAADLLGDAIHILSRIEQKLARAHSPYVVLFQMLRGMTTVVPEPLPDPSHGAMEEAMVTFGPNADGTEPLLYRKPAVDQPVTFYETDPRKKTGSTVVAAK